ncbi:MAG: caspase family protein [Bacteroidetes bacterium]|nr:caspase family protein [Bacteroidota bacterium]
MKSGYAILFLLIPCLLQAQLRLVLPIGHTSRVSGVTFSPDNRRVLTASEDGTAKIWDVASGLLLADLKAHTQRLNIASFSPDGRKVLTASADGTARVWSTASGACLATLVHDSYVWDARWSHDGSKIATASGDFSVRVWDTSGYRMRWQSTTHTDEVMCVAWGPGDSLIATGSKDLTLRVMEASTGAERAVFYAPDAVFTLAFSPEGNYLLANCNHTAVVLCDWRNRETKTLKESPDGTLLQSVFSPDGRRICIAQENGDVELWSLNPARRVKTLKYTPEAGEKKDRNTGVTEAQLANLFNRAYGGEEGDLPVSPAVWAVAFDSAGTRMVLCRGNGTVNVRDGLTLQCRYKSRIHRADVYDAAISSDGRWLATASADRTAALTDLATGEVVHRLQGLAAQQLNLAFSPDDKWLATTSLDHKVRIWEQHTGELKQVLSAHNGWVTGARFSADSRRLLTWGLDDLLYIWDVKTGFAVKSLRLNPDSGFNMIAMGGFSDDGKYVLAEAGPGLRFAWNASTGAEVPATVDTAWFQTYGYHPESKGLSWNFEGDTLITCYDSATGREKYRLQGDSGAFSSRTISEDGERLLTVDAAQKISLWNAQTGQLLSRRSNGDGDVLDLAFSADHRRFATTSNDHVLRVWDGNTGAFLYQCIALQGNEFVVLDSAGYYRSTRQAAKELHFVTPEMEPVTFEQKDLQLNRPDKVLQSAGCRDTLLIRACRMAWEKRCRRAGVNPSAKNTREPLPVLYIQNAAQIPAETASNFIRIHLRCNRGQHPLRSLQVWVNEVPLFADGITLHGRNSLDTSLEIALSTGSNRIEAGVKDVQGNESFRIPVFTRFTPAKPLTSKLYFIGIGMDRFADSTRNLGYSSKDIRDLAKSFKNRYGKNCETDTFFNENYNNVASVIFPALRQKLQRATPEDKVIIAYSGHGLLSDSLDYFLSTYNINFSQPETHGLPYEMLENLLKGIPARQRLLLIDACHSGELDADDWSAAQTVADSLGLRRGEAIPLTASFGKKLGLYNSFTLMQELFASGAGSTGATILAASAGTQFALERGDLENGVFTFGILEAMNTNKNMTVSALRQQVQMRVTELTGGLQQPASRGELLYHDWRVW